MEDGFLTLEDIKDAILFTLNGVIQMAIIFTPLILMYIGISVAITKIVDMFYK